jgi:hypothetical protein
MATEILSNINSVLQQKGIRVSANFVQSTFAPAFFQFFYASPGDLNVGDKVFVLYSVSQYIEAEITNITGSNITINTLIFILYPPTFTRFIVLPPETGSTDLDVNVVAAFNPVVIVMQRQDYKDLATQSDWNGTYYQIECGTVFMGEWVVNPGYEVGAVVQVISESGVAENFTILNISSLSSVLYATFNKTWSVFNPFFLAIVNILSRINFYVTLKITDNTFNPQTRELRFTPGASGMMRAEISGALRSLLNLNFTDFQIVETEIRTEDLNLYSPFYFATKDNWIGSSESWVNYFDPEDVKYCIAGAFQIGDPNNGYYNKYFGNTEGTKVYPELMPQWITQFENPVYFFGFPFSLSFLGNSQMDTFAGYFVRCKFTQADGTVDTLFNSPFVFTPFICLARLNIAEILNDPIFLPYTQNSKKIEIRFGRGESGLFLDAFAPITINVKRAIEQSCNTFFVRWLNTLGGWDYWLFEGKIYEGFKVENGNNYESYFDNISDTKDFENVTFKNVSPAVQVGSNTLTKNEAEGLKVLPTSPKIYWYNEDLSKWIGVRVEPGTFNIRSTKDDYFNIELTFVKPKYFNQFA